VVAAAAAAPDLARRRFCVAAPTYPLTVGAAPFNDAMVRALRRRADVEFLSWARPYPPYLYRGSVRDLSPPANAEHAEFVLDWASPASWHRAVDRARAFGAEALIVPWLHPVMAPPYLGLFRRARRTMQIAVVCHNVHPHERLPGSTFLTRSVLRQADVLVTHAPHQEEELRALGARGSIVEAFHPLFVPQDLADAPAADAVAGERARAGEPELLLLLYGAVRPYKGADLAIEAMARVDPGLHVHLVVAGRFWTPREELSSLADSLGVTDRVTLRDGFVSNDDTALLFAACDAALLPYRSATQSGVVAMAFGHGRPVIATSVGGLPAAVRDGRDGILTQPEDVDALARAIERMAREHSWLAGGARETRATRTFERYAELLDLGIAR
jgi:glycosyltransferase involved in cell wall biosynthesis